MSKPINFFKGHPTLSLIPRETLADAFKKVIVENDYEDMEQDPDNRHPLQYGTDPGNLVIRKAVIEWSNSKYNRDKNDPACVNLTAGSSYGIANILSACTRKDVTKHMFLVSPTYFLINYAFIDAGFAGKMSAVEETAGGEYDIDLDGFEQKLIALDKEHGLEPVGKDEINVFIDPTKRGDRKFYRYALYMVPTFSNPGGLTYSVKTRTKLLEIARKHDVLLISDDVYDFLNYNSTTCDIPKLNHIDQDSLPKAWRFGNTISNSSFSKIIAPGLRTGWQESPTPGLASQVATTGSNMSGGTPSQLNIFVVHELITSGKLDEIIAHLAGTFKSRSTALISALKEYLPADKLEIHGGDGGYFIWCEVKGDSVDMAHVLGLLKEKHDVAIAHGSHFEVSGDVKGWGKNYARLCVALLPEEDIKEGIKLWGQVLREEHPELY